MIKTIFSNWQTSSLGLLTISGTVIHLVFATMAGHADEHLWSESIKTILLAMGLIAAGDAAKSKKDVKDLAEKAATAVETGKTEMLAKIANGGAAPPKP